MKGLILTVLLTVLEVAAVMSGDSQLIADEPTQVPAIRREEAGIQSEVLVDAEELELTSPAPANHAEAI